MISPNPLAIGILSEGEGGPCNGRRPLKMSECNITWEGERSRVSSWWTKGSSLFNNVNIAAWERVKCCCDLAALRLWDFETCRNLKCSFSLLKWALSLKLAHHNYHHHLFHSQSPFNLLLVQKGSGPTETDLFIQITLLILRHCAFSYYGSEPFYQHSPSPFVWFIQNP